MTGSSVFRIRRVLLSMRMLVFAALVVPELAFPAPVVMVDTLPSAAEFVNYATIQVPIKELENVDARVVEEGISSIIAQMAKFAEESGATHICLFSSAAKKTRRFRVEAAQAEIKLKVKDAKFVAVLYRNGVDSPAKVTFLTGTPDKKGNTGYITIKKVSVPEGFTSDAWVYFNLPRIQKDAITAGATQVFLTAKGKGAKSAVVIPGASEPLQVYEKESEIRATWYIPGN